MDNRKILETIKMLEQEHLDIRTVTVGISLLDCIDSDWRSANRKIYDKMMYHTENLVKTTGEVSELYGIPIINNRISVTPISIIAGASDLKDYTPYAETLDRVAKEVGVDFVGGFSALVQKGFNKADYTLIDSIPNALASTDYVCSSVNVGSSKTGINMEAVAKMGEKILELAYKTKDQDSIGCAKLVVFANAVEDNPFMAGAFHGVGEPDSTINVGVSGPGVVKTALESVRGKSFDDVAETIKKTAFKITRMGELVGREVSKRLNSRFGIIDLSLAPTPEIGDSVGRILEEIGIDTVGGHGTTAALAMLNDAVKKGGIMASSHVGGLSGAFIPVSEDEGMIAAAASGHLSFDKLEAMTSVCSVGLDMIAIPGDTPKETISAIIADEAAIGVINNKTTAVRVIPVYGKGVGDKAEFGGLLGYAPIMDIGDNSAKRFIERGGLIPAPIHSFKN
ncbi:PFL family protein [Peptoniphilus catoniae]|uniref:PFL family protein n=1 Tax=Peptoniphilus catoniae TaxID=1660341 RepID=UPI0010FDB834|nr:PFL family protein [Peptoniphilus catoniae]